MARHALDPITADFRDYLRERSQGLVSWNPDRWGSDNDMAVLMFDVMGAIGWQLLGEPSCVGNALALIEGAGLHQLADELLLGWFAS